MKLMTNAIIRKSSFFLLGGMTAVAGWAVFAAGNIFENLNSSQPQGNNPVAIHATSPAQNTGGMVTMPFATTSHLRRTSSHTTNMPSLAGDSPAALPSAAMNSTSLFAHSTSVTVSGGNNRTATRNSNTNSAPVHSTVEDAKRVGASSFGGNMLALASATMITAPGATNAGNVASMSVNTSVAPGPRRTPPDPMDPFLNPIGSVPFVFFAILAVGYAVFTTHAARKSRQAEK